MWHWNRFGADFETLEIAAQRAGRALQCSSRIFGGIRGRDNPGPARSVNDNLGDYLIPVNADVPQIDVIMVPEIDNDVNPAGVKGLGELGNVGTAAAVANAVFHATGIRLRELPIRLDHLLV